MEVVGIFVILRHNDTSAIAPKKNHVMNDCAGVFDVSLFSLCFVVVICCWIVYCIVVLYCVLCCWSVK
jgi:hypothetical protein